MATTMIPVITRDAPTTRVEAPVQMLAVIIARNSAERQHQS